MVKRRVSSDTTRKTPRPRKKQAVTKTNSGKIKTLIRQNATNSPLLSLPSEIREKILVELIGNKLIHVKHLNYGELADAKGISYLDLHKADPKLLKRGAFRHSICVAVQSEQIAYDERVSGNATVSGDEIQAHCESTCFKRHKGCTMSAGGPNKLLPEEYASLTMDLKVLGASRQLYEECNHLLWATNTFSFDDPASLNSFLASLNPAQKRNLSNIHISTRTVCYDYPLSEAKRWSAALKLSYINMLRGVQNLYLCIQHESRTERSHKQYKKSLNVHVEPFLRLRALSPKNITVVVSGTCGPAQGTNPASDSFRWNRAAENVYAENLRARLAASDGAELVKADAELLNAAKEMESLRTAKISADVCRSKLESMIESAKQFKARAEEYDKQAEELVVEAAGISAASKKALSRGTKLRDNAELKRRSAEENRALAESLPLMLLAGKAAEAAAKLKRAKARVKARIAKNGVKTGGENPASSDKDSQTATPDRYGLEIESDNDDVLLAPRAWDVGLSEEEEAASDDEEKTEEGGKGERLNQHHEEDVNEEAEDVDEDDEMGDGSS